MQAIIGAGNVHYQENGKWKTILSNIFSNTTGRHTDLAFSAPYNQHKIYFPNSPGKSIITEIYGQEFSDWGTPALVWLDKKGKEIAEVQINSGCVGSPDNLELDYKEIFPFVDAKIINSTTSKELKYILTNRAILDNKPTDAVYLAFRENINFDKSWKLNTLSAEKNIAEKLGVEQVAKYYFSQNGKAILEINNPIYHDLVSLGTCADPDFDNSKNNEDAYFEGSYLIKNEKKNSFTSYILIPLEWLSKPERKFPITIDPTTNYYPGGTFPTYTANRSGNSGDWECFAGTYAGRTYQFDISYGWVDDSWPFSNPYMDGYASFDLSAIPDNAVINSATTYWYRYAGRTCGDAINLKHGMVQYNENLAESYDCNVDGNRSRNNNGYYSGTGKNGTGWQSQAANTSDITNSLSGNKFTAGWAYNGGDDCCTFVCGGDDGDYHHIYGNQHSTNKPYISIYYCVKPTITTQPVGQLLCKANTMNALSVVATGTGLTYQWQASNYTSCSAATSGSWQNITGATSSSYTPPKIAGTRLYRVIVTADCPTSVSGYQVTSSCVVVTVNPMDGSVSGTTTGHPYATGDNAPPIQTGICGNTILPSSSNVMSALLPGAIGAANNITTFSWSATGGSFSPTTGTTTTWTAPATPGSYTITVTQQDGCADADATKTCPVIVGSPACDYIYVAETGGADAVGCGGPNNPCRTLTGSDGALNKVSATRNYIRMATGTYTESNIVDLQSNLIIEGRYTVSGGLWSKSSNTGASTSISCSGIGDGTDATLQQHVMGFRSDNDDNWKLIDLNITTVAASGQTSVGNGKSNYGIYIANGSTGYEITRCNVTSGAATKGLGRTDGTGFDGTAGTAGSTGGNGNNQSSNGCNSGCSSGAGGSGGGGG
ncbi:MAG TPA: hypothetical protein PLF48_00870, partial [Chitinophagales bacterium]|nr:hypothetical protein [Chitinophagales bacterium]